MVGCHIKPSKKFGGFLFAPNPEAEVPETFPGGGGRPDHVYTYGDIRKFLPRFCQIW
jgi:hypothetical protein